MSPLLSLVVVTFVEGGVGKGGYGQCVEEKKERKKERKDERKDETKERKDETQERQ